MTMDCLNKLRSKLGVARKRSTAKRKSRSPATVINVEHLESRELLAITVDVAFDEADNSIFDGDISLRDAVMIAPAGETINFAPWLNGQTISLDNSLGDIAFSKNLTIDATALTNGITIDANDPTPTVINGDGNRVFRITGGDVTLKGLTLTGGDPDFRGSGDANGGAIYARGDVSLSLDGVTLHNNGAAFSNDGGGLYFHTNETEHLPTGAIEPRLVIRNSIIEGNQADEGGGLFVNLGDHSVSGSSGIHVQALGQTVLVENSQLLGNVAQNRGGGVAAWLGAGGELELVDSTVSGNTAGSERDNGLQSDVLLDSGGGVYTYMFSGDDSVGPVGGDSLGSDNGIAKLTIAGSTIDHNIAGSYGGGIAVSAKRQGPNLAVRSQVSVFNSTLSGNIVLRDGTEPNYGGELGKGGGVALAIYPNDANEGLDAHFSGVTITENRGEVGGGIWSRVPTRSDGRVRTWLTNTIVSANTEIDGSVFDNLYGSFDVTSTAYNLVGPTNTIFDYVTHVAAGLNTATHISTNDPKLMPLDNYAGPTRTHRLQATSRAIDAGSNSLAFEPFFAATLTTDQRTPSFDRIYDVPGDTGELSGSGTVDIGAYEIQGAGPRVINVLMAGTGADITPGVYDLAAQMQQISSGEAQIKPLVVGDISSIAVEFDGSMGTIAGDELGILGLLSGAQPVITYAGYNSTTQVATWNLSGVEENEHYLVILRDSIVDAADNPLDGDWVNPRDYTNPPTAQQVSDFTPTGSGDGEAGTDFAFIFTTVRLFGDADNDGAVGGSDLLAVTNNFGSTGTSSGVLLGDADDDGVVSGSDLLAVTNNFGNTLDFTIALLLDLNQDGAITYADFSLYDLSIADIDGDGDVDATDQAIHDAHDGYEAFWREFGDFEVELV